MLLEWPIKSRATFLWKKTADQHITLWSLSLTIFQEKLHVYLLKANRAKGGGVFDEFQSKRVYKLMNFCILLSNSTIQKVGCGSQIFPIMNFECGHKKITIKLTQDAITSY
jgi:hypothetical protein